VAPQVDVLVIGGGINGAGIARDLAGRGLSVVLCEKDDLAAHTSSASTKLIHGGLRYLEQFEFGLVRKALQEREVLLRSAPHIIWPMRFVMPHNPHMRPAWMIRLGILFYDNLARRELLPGSTSIALHDDPAGKPLRREYTHGFVYSDGWVDDSRLVVLNARDAADHGARILTRTECRRAQRHNGGWHAELASNNGQALILHTRAIVNAAGPWADTVLRDQLGVPSTRRLRLIKGSHIVVPRMFDHEMAYIFQSPDKRIVFAIPFQEQFTLIGTTDVEFHGDPNRVAINEDEINYLCALTKRYFVRPIRPSEVIWSYSGVRPLLDDAAGNPSAITRDYSLELNTTDGAPVLSVWGGKITTYRKLAEEAVDMLLPALGIQRQAWTVTAMLPGGDLAGSLTESNSRVTGPRICPIFRPCAGTLAVSGTGARAALCARLRIAPRADAG
jgi:glycerol-3-phosphate dehydrogenase